MANYANQIRIITGNAKDIASWEKGRVLGSWYKKQGNLYVLGTEIDCTDKNWDFEKYQGHGWFHKPDSYGTFSVGPSSDLIFKIKDYHNQNLKFSFNALAWVGDLPRSTAKVDVNNNYIRDIVFDENNENFSFIIEPSLVKGNELIIRFDIDHSGTAEKDGFQDLGMLWKKLRIDEEWMINLWFNLFAPSANQRKRQWKCFVQTIKGNILHCLVFLF